MDLGVALAFLKSGIVFGEVVHYVPEKVPSASWATGGCMNGGLDEGGNAEAKPGGQPLKNEKEDWTWRRVSAQTLWR